MLPQYMALSVSFVSLVCQTIFLKCNISLTEAHIFMKFVTYVYEIVLDHQPNFHKDPCKDARARGVNARTHVKKNLCVRSLGYIVGASPPVRHFWNMCLPYCLWVNELPLYFFIFYVLATFGIYFMFVGGCCEIFHFFNYRIHYLGVIHGDQKVVS